MPDAGWFTPSMLMLPLQALAAAVTVRAFALRVAPNIARLDAPASVLDSLAPFALALPLIGAGWHMGWDAAGNVGMKAVGAASTMPAAVTAAKANTPAVAGWIVLGGPIVIAMLALGAALLLAPLGPARTGRFGIQSLAAAAWSAVGALLLLLGAAHDLTIWAGQCAFAAGAVALWMNTPELQPGRPSEADRRAGSGMTVVLLASLVQAAAIVLAPSEYTAVAAAMAIATAAIIAALTAHLASADACIRLGGWTATYGVLLGLGAISLRHLLPQTFAMLGGSRDLPPMKVAYGFGAFALEATILLMFGAAALAHSRIVSRLLRICVGATLIALAAVLAAWRLARV